MAASAAAVAPAPSLVIGVDKCNRSTAAAASVRILSVMIRVRTSTFEAPHHCFSSTNVTTLSEALQAIRNAIERGDLLQVLPQLPKGSIDNGRGIRQASVQRSCRR